MSHISALRSSEVLRYVILPVALLSPVLVYWHHQRKELPRKLEPAHSESRPCRYQLDTTTSAKFTLPDGRKLGYAQYGSPNGRPVIAFHGLPGSRLEWTLWNELGLKHDARIIAVDRPGIGWSTPQPERSILDHAKDVEQLADHLGLDEFVVVGASGGGPYALACAHSIPRKRLKGVAIVCGIGPPDMSRRGMAVPNWLGWTFGWRYTRWLIGWHFSRQPGGRLDLDDETRLHLEQQQFSFSKLHERDAIWAQNEDFREDFFKLILRSCREAYGQGFDGFLLDGHLLALDWGFRLENIPKDLPVQLWYGRYDVLVPPVHGEQSALRIGDKADLRMLDETHSSLSIHHEDEILEGLLACFST